MLFTTTILGTCFFLGVNPHQKISVENKKITTSSVSMDRRQSSCFASDFLETVTDPLTQQLEERLFQRVTSGNAHGTWSIAVCAQEQRVSARRQL